MGSIHDVFIVILCAPLIKALPPTLSAEPNQIRGGGGSQQTTLWVIAVELFASLCVFLSIKTWSMFKILKMQENTCGVVAAVKMCIISGYMNMSGLYMLCDI